MIRSVLAEQIQINFGDQECDKSLEDSDDLPEPDVRAQGIADDLQAALEQVVGIAASCGGDAHIDGCRSVAG